MRSFKNSLYENPFTLVINLLSFPFSNAEVGIYFSVINNFKSKM